MGRKAQFRRLEKAAQDTLGSFELDAGTRFYYDEMEARRQIFLHAVECASKHAAGDEDWPQPPAILRVIARARDRNAALRPFIEHQKDGMGTFDMFPYDVTLFVERGEFIRHA